MSLRTRVRFPSSPVNTERSRTTHSEVKLVGMRSAMLFGIWAVNVEFPPLFMYSGFEEVRHEPYDRNCGTEEFYNHS